MKKSLLVLVFAILSTISFAQVTNTFNFTADLSAIIGTGAGKFDPAQDSIRVMGLDWDGLGVLIQGNRTMVRQGTTAIYKTSLVVQKTTSDSTKWKFKAYPDARFQNSGWETGSDRWVNFGANGATIELPTIVPSILPTVVTNVVNTINFTADISGILLSGAGGAFDPAQDSILVMGLDWDGGTNVTGNRRMVQDPFSPGIFRTTLSVQKTGDSTKWKFKAYPDARFSNGGWETGQDNWYLYGPNGTVANINAVPRIYPLGAPLTAPLDIFFRVDMNGAKNRYNNQAIPLTSLQFVGMRGGAEWLGSWSSGGNWLPTDTTGGFMKVLNDNGVNGDLTAGDKIWSRKVTVPAGTAGGFFEYKYAAMYPGADTINGGSSPLDNEGGFGVNHGLFVKDGPAIIRNDKFGVFTTDIRQIDSNIPQDFQLTQNYPNPFNPSTKIRYSISAPGLVTLKIYDILGNEVGTLVDNELAAGTYEATFNAIDMASGVYFYKLEAGGFTKTMKMMIMK
jgi:hypothetical protein